jgi:pimeloyl-ACP methyl ester carboxylesterase
LIARLTKSVASAALAAMVAPGCAATRPAAPDVRATGSEASAPLDPKVREISGARALWLADPEFGGTIYVVVIDPPGGATAPPLVLVHGLGTAGLRDFYPVLPALARSRRVVAFDLPGFGRSSRANERYTPARYAEVVAHVIARFAGATADVLGHSMGGAIALMHAGTHPAQVHRLVLVDAAGILHREAWFGHHLRRVTDPVARVSPEGVDELNQIVATLFSSTRPLDPVPDLLLLTPALRQKVLQGDPGRIAALSLILTDFSDAISAVSAPTLVVWGGSDRVAPPRTGELLSDRLAAATLTVLAGVGHNVMAEAPERLLGAIEPFLAASAPPSPAPAPPEASHGDVSCSGQTDLHLTGTYDEVVLDRCERASLERISMRRLIMRDSNAQLDHAQVASGIKLTRSRVVATGGRIGGEVALELADSEADLAGVALEPVHSPYRLTGGSRAIFSVCPVGHQGTRHLHGVRETRGDALEEGLE